MKTSLRLSLALASLFALAAHPALGQLPASNPFAAPSTLSFQAPDFTRIKVTDYQPAIEEGMKIQRAEMDVIANNPAPPTFANTIEAMEKTGVLLTRAYKVFSNIEQSDTNEAIQKIKSEVAPKLSAHNDAINLNPKLYARIKAIYAQRATLGLDPEATYLVERYNLGFVRAGADLSEADKATLMSLNEEESRLTTSFEEKLLADTNASAPVVANKKELAGATDGDLAAAGEAAKERKLDGKWVLALQNTTQQPVLSSLTDRALRQSVLAASEKRGNHGGENDTTAIIARLAQLRAQKAKLLGFKTYADYVLDDQMAKTPQNANRLMNDLVPASTAKARAEAARIQKRIEADKGGFSLSAADWGLYAEKVRKAEYDLDEAEVRPYFELDRVLNDGVFFAANKMYGITFKPRPEIPVYHPDVRVWEVFDADGKSLALYYGDYYQRSSKGGGAWCDTFVDQSRLMGTRPVVTNNLNLTKPAAGQPALISFSDATVIFHEFGHALHAMFQNITYPTLASTPRDYVEFPSQFNEHWATEPTVFANYAKHYKTGAPMPEALVAKIKKVKTFNQGYMTTEYLAAALLDMAWHSLPSDAPKQEVNAFEKATLERAKVALAEVPPRYRTSYFGHIWGGGYAAGYYAYLWAEVIDDDAYFWFKEHGGMTRENGQRFREMILSRAGSQDLATLYRAFRGRDPEVQPLLEERGLAPAKP